MSGKRHRLYNGNLTLIGMAGCGKSTNGVVLAKALGLAYADTDLIFQRNEGKSLSQIIKDVGLDEFVRMEAETIRALDVKNTCISTGGSVVYQAGAMAHLKAISKVIYLELGYPTIEKRIRCIKSRGIVIQEGKTLRDIYEERRPLYEKYADITVNTEGKTIEETVEEIIEILQRGDVS